MRSLMVMGTAVGGAWLMVHFCQAWVTSLNESGVAAQNPLGGILFVPALLVGGLVGAFIGSLLCPFRS